MKKTSIRFFISLLWILLGITFLGAQPGGCGNISFTVENYQPCCYRLHVDNSSECYPELHLLINAGTFVGWGASMPTGWTGQLVSPTELKLTHSSGHVPIGTSTPVGFCLPGGVSPLLTILYDYTCPLGKSCFFEIPLEGCPIVADACISGVKYVDVNCAHLPYSNQPTLPGWTIQLYDGATLLDTMVTDATGAYAFCDLPPGNYVVKELSQPGWTASLPPTGQSNVALNQSQQAERNFGNCPVCSCDSISLVLQPIPVNSDTGCFNLSLLNHSPYCFSFIEISLTTGHFTSNMLQAAGWSVVSVSPQLIRLYPPGALLPGGSATPLKFCATGSSTLNFTVSTHWNQGATMTPCNRTFSYPNPAPPTASCCPAGNVIGPEQVTNGNFEAGNSGFTAGPGVVLGCSCLGGTYCVVSNFTGKCASYPPLFDHTFATTAGHFLAVDGNKTTTATVWTNYFPVVEGQHFCFSFWAASVYSEAFNLGILFNGNTPAGGLQTISQAYPKWTYYSVYWTSTVTGTIPIAIRQVLAGQKRDFGLDDISFRSCTDAVPCHADFTITLLDNCGHVHVTGTSTGPPPISYTWCDGSPTPDLDLFLPCGEHTFCVTVTCGDGSTATVTKTIVITDNIPPVAICQLGVGVVLNANCTFPVTPAMIDGGSTDNCQIQSLAVSPTLLTGCGDFEITLTVTDWCNNKSTCTTGLQTIEGEPPLLTCPVNTTVNGVPSPTGGCQAVYQPVAPTAIDNCDPSVTLTNNAPPVLQAGANVITWTAEDDCGNIATCEVVVTVTCDTMPHDTSDCCAFAIYLVNKYTDGHIKRVRVSGTCDTEICCADPDEWQQFANYPNSVDWFLEDTLGIPHGDAIDNDFIIYLKRSTAAHHLQVEWLDGGGTIVCRHFIEITCDGPFAEDEDWTLYTTTSGLDDPKLFVLAAREEEEDDESDCDDSDVELTCEAAYNVTCSGGNTYLVTLNGPGNFDQFYWNAELGPTLPVISSVQNPSFQVTAGGSYVISLLAINSATKDTCASDVEIIIPQINPDFTWNQLQCGTTVNFHGGGWSELSDIKNVNWTCTGVPGFPATGTDVTHTFPPSGVCTATMTVEDKYGCSHQTTKNIFVDTNCKAKLSAGNYIFCAGDCVGVPETFVTVYFQNNSSGGECPIVYDWAFGDGQTLTTNNLFVTHTYKINCPPTGQVFTASLSMKDNNNCTSTGSISVEITPCLTDFTYVVCPDGRVDFTGSVDGEWSFPGSTDVAPWPYSDLKGFDGLQKKVRVRYPVTHTYEVTFKGYCSNGGICQISKEIQVVVDCCTKYMQQKDTALFTYAGQNYKMVSRFKQSQKPAEHKIKATTSLKKSVTKKGHTFYRPARAVSILASFWGTIYARDTGMNCNCKTEEYIPSPGNPTPTDTRTNAKKAKIEQKWQFRKFRSRKDSITSGHSVTMSSVYALLVNLRLGKECAAFHWWTDWY